MDNTSVLFNQETGQVEEVPSDQAERLLAAKTHALPLNNLEGSPIAAPQDKINSYLEQGYHQPSNEQLKKLLNHAKYSATTEQIKTGLEGAAEGALGFVAPAVENALFNNQEERAARKEVNPDIHTTGEVAGFLGPMAASLGTAGAARLGLKGVAKAGEAISAASKFSLPGALEAAGAGVGKLAGKAGVASELGKDAIKGAFEMGLLRADEKVREQLNGEEPDARVGSLMSDIGLHAVLGGVLGPAFGALGRKLGMGRVAGKAEGETERFVSELDKGAFEAGDLAATIKTDPNIPETEKLGILEGLKQQKKNAPELYKIGKEYGLPVLEGHTTANETVERVVDSLINGAPTIPALRTKALYNEGYNKAAGMMESTLGEGSSYTKAQLGNDLKESITRQINEANKPISALYDKIKTMHEVIPLEKEAMEELSTAVKGIKEFNISPSSPQGRLARRVLKEAPLLKTVDDVKLYKTELMKSISPTASSAERHMAGRLAEELSTLERGGVERFANKLQGSPEEKVEILDLLSQRKEADKQFKGLVQKIAPLAEQMGKRKVNGVSDAVHFLEDLVPEDLAKHVFDKGDSEFMNYFAKNFPEQMDKVRAYQKGLMKDASMVGEDFSAKKFAKNVNKLEPEIRAHLFTPDELKRIGDMEKYLNAFPKNFNPSATSHSQALREFFGHGITGLGGAALANVRDLGMEKFIKHFGGNAEMAAAQGLGAATAKGYRNIIKGVDAVISPDKAMSTALYTVSLATRDKLKDLVDEYTADPEKMFTLHEDVPIDDYKTAFAMTAARSVQYLASLKPRTEGMMPLDRKLKPSASEISRYNQALDIAEKPMIVLHKMKQGALTQNDVLDLKNLHPEIYSLYKNKLLSGIIESKSKHKEIPYKIRMSMSLFLGEDLDSTLTPRAILAAQPVPVAKANQMGSPGMVKQGAASLKALSKMPSLSMTPSQARMASKTKI